MSVCTEYKRKQINSEYILDSCHFAFNVWDFDSAAMLMSAANREKHSIILQTSSSIFERLPKSTFRAFVTSYAQELGMKAWLNLDHCSDMNLLTEAIDSGWDMVMADGSALPIEENIAFTNTITKIAMKKECLSKLKSDKSRA